jgi:hypothetical protein
VNTEIEGESEDAVRRAASALGFHWDDAVIGPATMAYRKSYADLPDDFIMDDVPEIRFDAPLPSRLRVAG